MEPAAAHATTRPALECRGVSIRYAGTLVLRDVSLRIPGGKITAIVGPSGCGKTSFLQSLNRITDLIPGCRVSGEVLLEGGNVYDAGVNLIALRRRMGMIFQKPNPFPLSIGANLDLPLREHRLGDRRQRSARVRQTLQEVGLWEEVGHRLNDSALSLSGGQQQRLCIARALVLEPDVLLFDEPCSALDPLSSRTVERLIQSLRRRATIVIVTHNLAQARRLADHGAMFWYEEGAGRLIEAADADVLFHQPQHPVTAAYMQGIEG